MIFISCPSPTHNSHIQNLTFPTLQNDLLSDSIKSFFWQFISTLLWKLYAKMENKLLNII